DVALGERAPLVDALLAARQGDLDLDASVLEIEPQRHERQALLGHARGELVDLPAVSEQLAVARGLVIRAIPLRVGLDRAAHEPQLPPALLRERLAQRDLAGAQRLDLGARERDARLEALENVKLVPRLAVAR